MADPLKIGEETWLLSQHVDGLEITCSLDQVPLLLKHSDYQDEKPVEYRAETARQRVENSGSLSVCDLEARLESIRRKAKLYTSSADLDAGWEWTGGGQTEPVILLARSPRRGKAFTLETSDWMLFLEPLGSVIPRLTFQLRADYLLETGAAQAFDEVRTWAQFQILPLINATAKEVKPVWKISRLDLAADIAGVSFDASDLGRFTTKAKSKREWHEAHEAVGVHSGRRFTGFDLGRRGSKSFARIYDKTLEADDDSPIREVWARAGYSEELHGEIVWRVEFEIRSALLRELVRSDHSRLNEDPRCVLDSDLDQVWQYLVETWLQLRVESKRSRVERRQVEGWWRSLATLGRLNPSKPERSPLKRRPALEEDPEAFLRSAVNSLSGYAALLKMPKLNDALNSLRLFATKEGGQEGFSLLVAKSELRRDRHKSSSKAAVRARAQELTRESHLKTPSTKRITDKFARPKFVSAPTKATPVGGFFVASRKWNIVTRLSKPEETELKRLR